MPDESLTTSIKDLPEVIIARLQEATELSNVVMIDQVIKEIRNENAQLAGGMKDG